MVRMREHIHRLDVANLIAVVHKYIDIAGKRVGGAGHINYLLCFGGDNAFEKSRCTAGARRIHYNDIDLFVPSAHFNEEIGSVGAIKIYIIYTVELRVDTGVPYGVLVQLDGNNLTSAVGRKNTYRSDSGIGVNDPFLSGESGKFESLSVELLSPGVVYLIKRTGGNSEKLTHELVGDISVPIEDDFGVAEDKTRKPRVDTLYDGCDFRKTRKQRLYKIVLRLKRLASRNKNDHNFTRPESTLDKHMAQKSPAGVFVVDR